MKKVVIILVLASCFIATSFAQNAPKIQRAYAFYTMSTPGMAMTDEKGNTINPTPIVDHFIYVETPGIIKPDITNVSYNLSKYKVTVGRAETALVNVGKSSEMGKEITLRTHKGYSLWKIDLQLISPENDKKSDGVHISINGISNKRPYTFRIYRETQLITPDRY